jgi:hypothetical protein
MTRSVARARRIGAAKALTGVFRGGSRRRPRHEKALASMVDVMTRETAIGALD